MFPDSGGASNRTRFWGALALAGILFASGAVLVVEPAENTSPPSEALEPVHLRIDAARGPGGGEPLPVDPRLYGLNLADWQQQDYHPDMHPVFLAYLEALHPGILRWPAGETSQERVWERSPRSAFAERVLTPEHVDAFIALANEVGAEPLIAVNVKTGTPREAADLVRYVNVERGHNVTWWQIGNEPDLPDGKTRGTLDYSRKVVRFANAMQAVDPDIRIVGGEIMTGAHVMGANGKPDWAAPILARAGSYMDAVSFHHYPLDSDEPDPHSPAAPTIPNLLQEETPDWRPSGLGFLDEVFPELDARRAQLAPHTEVWVTEYGEDPSNGGHETLSATQAGALWHADTLGRFAANGVDAAAKFVFKSGSSHNFTLLDEDYQPRPAYHVYWLYANHFGQRVVHAESGERERVNVHASLRDDGRLAVMLINKEETPRAATLDIAGFRPSSEAQRFVLEAGGLDQREASLNGQALRAHNVAGPDALAPESFTLEDDVVALPGASVTLVLLEPE